MVLWYSGRCDSSYYVLQAGDASIASFRRRYQLVRPKPKAVPNRKAILRILHSTASLFKQARQGRVTDKGKERVGSKPATAYARQQCHWQLQTRALGRVLLTRVAAGQARVLRRAAVLRAPVVRPRAASGWSTAPAKWSTFGPSPVGCGLHSSAHQSSRSLP